MEVTVDEYGRIVIPKPLRDQLGLEAGTELTIVVESDEEEHEKQLTLRPLGQSSPLRREGSVLVHTGTADESLDPATSVHRARTSRAKANAGTLHTTNE
jgi:AbrB family looped-hinge helix DNA binding protein